MKSNELKDGLLESIARQGKRWVFAAVCFTCMFFHVKAQAPIEYRGSSDVLFATSDSRLFANVVEAGDLVKVEILAVGYVHASVLAYTLVYDTTKLTLMDKTLTQAIPFTPAVHQAMELSSSLPHGYGIDVTQHDVIQGVPNMAYFKGGLFTTSYDFDQCWKVQYGEVDKAFTLFLKKKTQQTVVNSSDLGVYLGYLPKREPYFGIDVLNVGYKYGSGSNIHLGGGVFMNYFNPEIFAFRWTSTVTTDTVSKIKQTTAQLNGTFERSRFNPAQDTVTLIDNPHFTPSVALPNTLLAWDTISRYGFIYAETDANLTFTPFSKNIKVDGTDYQLTALDLQNGSFTANNKTFTILPYTNSVPDQTVVFNQQLTNLQSETDYYAWAFMFYAFETSDVFPALGEKIFFRTIGCEDPTTPTGSAAQTLCLGAVAADLQAIVDTNAQLKWFQNGMELQPNDLLIDGETYYAKAVNGVCISGDSLAVVVTINQGPQISVAPAGAYMAKGSQAIVVVTDDNPTAAKHISVADKAVASAVLIGDTVIVFGIMAGNTEITYTSVNEYGCVSTYIIPVQVGVGNPTGILAGKDIVLCNVPNGDTATVQIAYIMGGVSPWNVTISDNNGLFSVDTLINSLNDLPVNLKVPIPQNMTSVPQYTVYSISNITDAMGNSKQTHYGTVRIGTNPTPSITAVANQTQTVCAGTATLPVSCSGVATRYRFSLDSQIGIMNFTDNGIPSFTAVNPTVNPITATIVIIPEYWYNGVVCIGEADTAYITVLPAVSADFAVAVQGLGKIQFTDRSSNAVSWSWNFGDGTTDTVQSPLHTFGISGTYTVALTVVSADGCISAISKTIMVSANTDLAANFIINEMQQCVNGNLFQFTNQSKISIPNGHAVSGYLWHFGDGDTAMVANPSHTYAHAGIYTVTLIVTESPTGTQSSISQTVKVLDLPTISLQTPPALCEGGRLQIPVPAINWKGHQPVAGIWSLDGYMIDLLNTRITAADSGKLLQYTISTICGEVVASAGTITVYALPEVDLSPITELCEGDLTAVIGCTATSPQQQVIYSIAFDANALSAGLSNISNAVLTGNSITISLPNGLSAGVYNGTLTTASANGCTSSTPHHFQIRISKGVQIVNQPQSVSICGEDGFSLSVTANGKNLSYQWYKNGSLISGATASTYTVTSSDTTDYGVYFVEVSGDCGMEISQMVEVDGSRLFPKTKWSDVIYIPNSDKLFVAYQWYKDGNPIGQDGNFQSYLEAGGLDGTYYVVVTYADGTQAVSCPLEAHTPNASGRVVSIYPNPAQPYSEITVDMKNYPQEEVAGAKMEIIDVLGQYVTEIRLESPYQKVYLTVSSGIYMYRITTMKSEVITGKIVVQQ